MLIPCQQLTKRRARPRVPRSYVDNRPEMKFVYSPIVDLDVPREQQLEHLVRPPEAHQLTPGR